MFQVMIVRLNATLRTEMMQIQDGGYSAVDPTSPVLSTLYGSFTV